MKGHVPVSHLHPVNPIRRQNRIVSPIAVNVAPEESMNLTNAEVLQFFHVPNTDPLQIINRMIFNGKEKRLTGKSPVRSCKMTAISRYVPKNK